MMISSNPLVSVVLSTYNDEIYIRESIDAVLGQTYKNFEFIIWNDGSTDATEEIIKSFKDDRIRYYYHENTGLGQALALACGKAKGKYIARIDGDDICLPYRLEKEITYLETHLDVILVSSSVIYIDENGKTLGRSYPWTWNRNIKRQLNIVHPAVMFRKDIYDRTCGYLDIKSAQDRILWSKMAKYGKFAIIKEPLIKYRWLTTSLSHIIDNKNLYAIELERVRQKLCTTDKIAQCDIVLHNRLYKIASKRYSHNGTVFTQSVEGKIALLLSNIIGFKITEKFIIFLKNIYAYIKY